MPSDTVSDGDCMRVGLAGPTAKGYHRTLTQS